MALIFFGIFLITAKHLQSIQGKGKEEKETAGPSSLDYWKSLEFLTSLSNRPTRKTTDLTKHVCNLTHMQCKIHTPHNQYFHVEWLLKNYYLAFFSGAFFNSSFIQPIDSWCFIFRCSLFIVQGESDSKCLVSDLFDVNVSSTVEDMSAKTEIRIPWGSGIVGHVAASAKKVNIPDCYADERFNPVSVINSMSVRLCSINKIFWPLSFLSLFKR